jgi:signal transduction histidine kinase/ligand-binding sensor domain-containing protein/ActR/RegA family two-component response regulator
MLQISKPDSAVLNPNSHHRTSWYLRLLALTLLIGLGTTTQAAAQRHLVHRYDHSNGIPCPNISDIAQDHDGRMWFATRKGLASYDGVSWSNVSLHGPTESVEQSHVLVDELDQVWSLPAQALNTGGLRQDGKWQSLPELPDHPLLSNRWSAVTTVRVGDEVLLLASVENFGTFTCDGQTWRRIEWSPALADAEVTDFEMHAGELFVATTRGLYMADLALRQAVPVEGTSGERILGLKSDPTTGNLWVLADPWLGHYGPKGLELVVPDHGIHELPPEHYEGPVIDKLGAVYVAGFVHVLRIESDSSVQLLSRPSGLAKEGATALFADRESNIWVGSTDGLSKIVSFRTATFDTEHGLLHSEVTSVLRSQAGHIVLGHPKGLTLLASKPETVELDATNDAGNKILDITEDLEGSLWIAMAGKGLAHRSPSGGITWVDVYDDDTGTPNSVLTDRQGRIWVAKSHHLFRDDRDGQGGFELVLSNPLSQKSSRRPIYRKIHQGRDDRVFLATAGGGVVLFDGDSNRIFESDTDLLSNNVVAVHDATDGETWLGTLAGLRRIQGDEIVPIENAAPWMEEPVYFIMQDAQGSLWCGTEDGVVHWDRSNPGTDQWRRLTVEDGVAGRETNRDGGWLDTNGDVWIGTESGVTTYRSRYEIPNRPSPTMRILDIDIDGHLFAPDQPVNLDPGHHVLSFQFRGTGFVDESRIEFRYRLVGFDTNWSKACPVPGNSVRYTNLTPGSYRFEIQARSMDQPWSPVAQTATILLPHPLWQRAWFQLLAVLCITCASYGLLWTIARQRTMRELEREVRLRVKEVRKLEEEFEQARKLESLGVLAGGIAHDFNNLLTVLNGSFSLLESGQSMTFEQLAICRDGLAATERAQALARQLLTFSRGGTPLLRRGSIAKVVNESARFMMRGSEIRCDCEVPSDLWVVEMDPDQISQVMGNLLLNAQQASEPGTTIRIRGHNRVILDEAGLEARWVEIEVQDEGKGISIDRINRIFDPYYSTTKGGSGLGLATSYSIVNRHNGRLEVKSATSLGTTFRMLIPAASSTSTPLAVHAPSPTLVSPLSIMVMDDDPGVRHVIRRMLVRLGHKVISVQDGREALEIFKLESVGKSPIDAVLMDLTIPAGVGGQEAVRNLLAFDPDARAIAFSGYSDNPVMADYISHGFRARLTKPVTLSNLKVALAQATSPGSVHTRTSS